MVFEKRDQTMAGFRPLNNLVLIRKCERETKSKGGITLVSGYAQEGVPQEADVIAVGRGNVLTDGSVRPLDIKVGDRVLILEEQCFGIKIEGAEYLIASDANIFGVIEA